MSKSRLLVVASTYPRWHGDSEPGFVHELSKRLTQYFDVHVLAPHASSALLQESVEGVTIHRFRYAPDRLETLVNDGGILGNLKRYPWKWMLVPAFFLGMGAGLFSLVRKLKPQSIHAHWIVPQGFVLFALKVLGLKLPPYLITSHGADLFSLNAPIFRMIKRSVLRDAGAISVVSRVMSSEMVNLGVESRRVSIIPMGADLGELFVPPGNSEQRIPGEILFVGRLVEKKGVQYLLKAMPMVLSIVPHAKLIIVGQGPEYGNLDEEVKRLSLGNFVSFVGAIPQQQLPGFYRRASIMVAPFVRARSGDQEGLGLVTIEAIGCGCPVLIGDLPAVRDILGQDDHDCLVQPDDVAALALRIVAVLGDVSSAVARTLRLRNQLLNQFDWGVVTEQYAECIHGMTAGK